MKHLVPTLSTLALIGMSATALSAASISPKEDNLTIGLSGALQTRATIGADGTTASGGDYDPLTGTNGQKSQAVHFEIRRLRLGISGTYKDDWRGVVTLAADKADSDYYNSGRAVSLYAAYVAKKIKTGDIDHEILFGLDKPFTNESSYSSSAYLLPTNRPSGDFIDYAGRSVGVNYKLISPMFVFGAGFMNGKTVASTTTPAVYVFSDGTGAETTPGYIANARIEMAPGAAMMPKKKQESYLGAEGTHVLLGLEVLKEWNKQVAVTGANAATAYSSVDTTIWGPDLLAHFNGLTGIAEWKHRSTQTEAFNNVGAGGAPVDPINASVWSVQAGYAFPMPSTMVLEPALRFSKIDMDRNNDPESSSYRRGVDYNSLATEGRNQQSGALIEAGVNLYITGNSNKLQLSYLDWKAEADEGAAHMFILQHQLTF